jgi:hypothetical protein
MLLAVPLIISIAFSILKAFRSGIFVVAISFTWSMVSFPTLSLFGVPEPLTIPAAFLISSEAGGVFKIKEKDLSL